eukprot:m.259808 g.259808  ORF g.259808 m.259808 type:complete len:103 (-) comp38721_c0_seq1:1236-1544(-)
MVASVVVFGFGGWWWVVGGIGGVGGGVVGAGMVGEMVKEQYSSKQNVFSVGKWKSTSNNKQPINCCFVMNKRVLLFSLQKKGHFFTPPRKKGNPFLHYSGCT